MNTISNDYGVKNTPVYPINNMTQKSSNGCLNNGLKIGCGFLAGVGATILAIFIFGMFMTRNNLPYYNNDDSINEFEKKDIRYFYVKSKKGEAKIHTGMPKDSVIMLLGKPNGYNSTEYLDEITYEYGPYNTNMLSIEFENGKVSGVRQF